MVTWVWTRAIISPVWNGLVMKSTAPASNPRTLSFSSSRAERKITAVSGASGSSFRRRHVSYPSMPGIITSSSTSSGRARRAISSASSPLRATSSR